MISRRLFATILKRPDLWAEAVRTLFAVAPAGWWRRAPRLPLPDAAYADWRLATAHGDSESPLRPDELVRFLEWRKRQHRLLGRV
jgi:hypothetical protein